MCACLPSGWLGWAAPCDDELEGEAQESATDPNVGRNETLRMILSDYPAFWYLGKLCMFPLYREVRYKVI